MPFILIDRHYLIKIVHNRWSRDQKNKEKCQGYHRLTMINFKVHGSDSKVSKNLPIFTTL